MTAPLLTVVKARYGRSPWRIVYVPSGQELPHASFDRKRDAVAVRDKLLAAVDWAKYPDFTAEDKAAMWNIIWATPGVQEWARAVLRQRASRSEP